MGRQLGGAMREFRWLSAIDLPRAHDLRRCGWQLAPEPPGERLHGGTCPVLAPMGNVDAASWLKLLGGDGLHLRPNIRRRGASEAAERARLLRLGFGDVVAGDVELAEVDARASRIAMQTQAMPRWRNVDGLILDLFARDALAEGRPIGLHPREFGLLWRLADTPCVPVSKAELVADVWRLGHVPETNSLAVHVSRLRAKLSLAGFDGLIHTAPAGGYVLIRPEDLPLAMTTVLAGKGGPVTLRMFFA